MGTSTVSSGAAAARGDGQPGRVYSVDVFRGMTMVWMISNGFGLAFYAWHPWIGRVARQFDHAVWEGMTAWDLVQPFFMFIVGVAVPLASRSSWARVLRRCVLLVLCASLLKTYLVRAVSFEPMNVLSQIAFTYPVAYALRNAGWPIQGGAALGLLAAHACLFAAGGDPWVKHLNIGARVDRAILGQSYSGGYASINFISSAANTIFGLMAGRLLTGKRSEAEKVRILLGAALAMVVCGLLLSAWIPVIKRIWTAPFALISTGCSLAALAAFYWLTDVRLWRKGTAIFAMVGANSIFIYLFHEFLYPVSRKAAVWLIGPASAETAFPRMLWEWAFIGLQIAVCWALYRRRIFFKL